MKPPTPSADGPGIPLAEIPSVPAAVRERLAGRWLRTAEEVLAAAAVPGAAEAMRSFLQLDDGALQALLADLRRAVPAARRARLEQPPARPGGLGLRLPDSRRGPSPPPG
ncbi:MAG: hypothetical protein ACKO3N_14715 [Verrucomicrobiota bacterium]